MPALKTAPSKPALKWKSIGGKQVLMVYADSGDEAIDELKANLPDILFQGRGFEEGKVRVQLEFTAKKGGVPALGRRLDGTRRASQTPFDARARGLELVEIAKAAEGGAWSGEDLKRLFSLTPSTLHRRRREHRIVYWRDARHAFFYPRWQFTDSGALLRGIEEVLGAFKSSDEWRIMRYFLTPRNELAGKRPLDLLRAGEVEKVVSHAHAHAAEGSW